jgi:hypothetical protein
VVRATLRRIGRDLRHRNNIEAYVVSLVSVLFALLSVVGDLLSDRLLWAVVLAGLGLLVYRITVPDTAVPSADALLRDRAAFTERPFSARARDAGEICLFAPSGIHFLTAEIDALRTVLARPEGLVRVVVLDPDAEAAVDIAGVQLDDATVFGGPTLRPALGSALQQLERMERWKLRGRLEYRLIGYNPGVSLLLIDPADRRGSVLVEVHGVYNEATTSRMHLTLDRAQSERWFAYWVDQFEHIWQAARRA